jgi:hypothetical protein
LGAIAASLRMLESAPSQWAQPGSNGNVGVRLDPSEKTSELRTEN